MSIKWKFISNLLCGGITISPLQPILKAFPPLHNEYCARLKLASMPHISIFDADSTTNTQQKLGAYIMWHGHRYMPNVAIQNGKTNHFGCFCHKVFCRLIKMSAILNGRHDSKWSEMLNSNMNLINVCWQQTHFTSKRLHSPLTINYRAIAFVRHLMITFVYLVDSGILFKLSKW